jgi:hypothetical protein
MITDQQFNEWAQSSTKNPVLLVEITHKDGTVYLSDQFYATNTGETPEHISYDVCLKESVIVERTLDQDSLSGVRVFNDGSLDYWLEFLFVGYTIEVFIGDKSWPREDFKRQMTGEIESFEQLTPSSFEFTSSLSTTISDSVISKRGYTFSAGNHLGTIALYQGTYYGSRMYSIGNGDDFNREDVKVRYDGYEVEILWVEPENSNVYGNNFLIKDYSSGESQVTFSCNMKTQKFKELFIRVCEYVNQPVNLDNLNAYPFDPNVTFLSDLGMTFSEYLNLTLETINALLWINDEGEIEFYRKEIPDEISINTVTSWVNHNDNPSIKTITTESPAGAVVVRNPNSYHNTENGPYYYEYNDIDIERPYRTVITHSYAEDSEAIAEARRLADLLSVTRRTYSVSIDRISPEIHIGAIVNIYSPKDRWNNGTEGLNALVVGFTQSYKSNKSELIVWR